MFAERFPNAERLAEALLGGTHEMQLRLCRSELGGIVLSFTLIGAIGNDLLDVDSLETDERLRNNVEALTLLRSLVADFARRAEDDAEGGAKA